LAVICPTVTARDRRVYDEQVSAVEGFAKRLHIDLSDAVFTSSATVGIEDAYLPAGIHIDMHIMYELPERIIAKIINLSPQLVILHYESSSDLKAIFNLLKQNQIKTGLAILQQTSVETASELIDLVDHLLVFSGELGSFGGQTDLNLLSKVEQARNIKPELEIGWDGGVNAEVTASLIKGGVDVLNVGSYIQESANPRESYEKLSIIAEGN
jgi:ribulose-phosphate 3-epimerase